VANAGIAGPVGPRPPTARDLLGSGKAEVSTPAPAPRPSALLNTRVVYCGDCLEQLQSLPDACVDGVYIDPPFDSNRNYEISSGARPRRNAPSRAPTAAGAASSSPSPTGPDAEQECAAFHNRTGRIIKLLTVQEILDEEHVQKM
jgi:hypothetical protein